MTHPLAKEHQAHPYAWTLHNVMPLTESRLSEMSVQNIAEEVENRGKSVKSELVNRLAVLIAHLLKWQLQPERRGNSWKYTIKEQRHQVSKLLKENPSLMYNIEEKLSKAYLRSIWIVTSDLNSKNSF